MTATLDDVTRNKRPEPTAEEAAAAELVRLAREQGLSLTGPGGLLKQLAKTVIETALNEEITEHLGYEKHDPDGQGAGSGNVWNQRHLMTVLREYEDFYNTHRPYRTLKQAAPLRPPPDDVTDLDQFRVRRRDRAGGGIHEYRLVA
jgi:hypothetical protein